MKSALATNGTLFFWCPACDGPHAVYTRPTSWRDGQHPVWEWNGDLDRPTVSPSVRVDPGSSGECHFHLRDGVLHYCSDSRHSRAGESVPLPDWPW